jgi:hypothetical protein
MKRVLSLLLLIPFLVTQAWAISGGPYDSNVARSLSAYAGTYGVIMQGSSTDDDEWNNKPENKAEIAAGTATESSAIGFLGFSVPRPGSRSSGTGGATGGAAGGATGGATASGSGNTLTYASMLIFDQGLMYTGVGHGIIDIRSGKLALLSQATHYAVRVASNGITQTSAAVPDAILNGVVNLGLSLNYLTGLIEAEGKASFTRYETLLDESTTTTSTDGTVTNAQSTGVVVTVGADGSNTSTVTTTNTDQLGNQVTVTKQLFDPSKVRQAGVPNGKPYLVMSASGARQDPFDEGVFAISAPSAGTNFQYY